MAEGGPGRSASGGQRGSGRVGDGALGSRPRIFQGATCSEDHEERPVLEEASQAPHRQASSLQPQTRRGPEVEAEPEEMPERNVQDDSSDEIPEITIHPQSQFQGQQVHDPDEQFQGPIDRSFIPLRFGLNFPENEAGD